MTASTADAIIPFDFVPPRLDEAEARLREDADAVLPELLPDDTALVDFLDFPELVLLEDDPDFPDVDRDVELEPLLFEADDADLDPDLVDLDAVPLPVADDLELDDPPDADFELPDDLVPALFLVEEPFEVDLPVERDALDFDVEVADFDLDDDDFEPPDLEAVDFDPPDLDAEDFEEPDFELEDFLVVAIVFLRIIDWS